MKNFLEKKEFSNENPFILGVGEGSNSILHLRGAQERYPDKQLTRNKCVVGRNNRDMPCINFLTEILPGPALTVLAFRPVASNSHNVAGFKSRRYTKQLVCANYPKN